MIKMIDSIPENILKVRDDREPVYFEKIDDKSANKSAEFKLCWETFHPSWLQNATNFDTRILRERVEPWLTSLFQSEHLSLLAGSGLSVAVSLMATDKVGAGMGTVKFPILEEEINAAALSSARAAGRDGFNIEDQIRVANELLRGLEILNKEDESSTLQNKLKETLTNFANSILAGETAIAEANQNKRQEAFNALVTFLMSFASRTGTRDRVNIFTTNYDRVIEMGAELAGMHLLDRFVGNISPIFRSSRLNLDMHYNPPGMRGEPRYLEGVARYTKLHGSVDWVQTTDGIRRIGVPFGAKSVDPFFDVAGFSESAAYKLMVYPNAAKDIETAGYPYVDLFRDFAAAICRPNSTLVTYGYSFGDDHINRVIKDMLTIPSTHLVIISFDDRLGRIMKTFKEWGRSAQTSLMIGPALADFSTLSERYLPKPAIDKTTFRMSELLRQRMGTDDSNSHGNDSERKGSVGVSKL